jgi:hypothetical protein
MVVDVDSRIRQTVIENKNYSSTKIIVVDVAAS